MAAILPTSSYPLQRSKHSVSSNTHSESMVNSKEPLGPPPVSHKTFYDQENIARLCARFITHLFGCPECPPNHYGWQVELPYYIAYAIYRTKLPTGVIFAALALLQRLKSRFPSAKGSSGHRLFISAFMIASKVMCDDTYSNKSWSVVAQAMFTVREVNQMEREMCGYLDWELNVEGDILASFQAKVVQDFAALHGPYPTYSLQDVSKHAARATASKPSTPVSTQTSTSPSKIMPTATVSVSSFISRQTSHFHQYTVTDLFWHIFPRVVYLATNAYWPRRFLRSNTGLHHLSTCLLY
ncbi:hypothetical protein D9757_003491 [Collybiopsis confluens]|uniref:Cyclin N-terminal domain-containing protein n=1 Tax=Collybiopsis confluens TaxID=2823264 RepID=A0A8H5HTS2_9AGAR|nr:hypothetical protein D9757_003491 [Collybiopsis confluens]